MKGIIERVGDCLLKPAGDYYTVLARAIVFQQLSTKAANTIYNRLIEQMGGTITTENVLKLSDEQFKASGVSRQKRGYLRDLSQKFQDGDIKTDCFPELSDDELIELLTTVKGIGIWSAKMFLIFALNRMDVLPFEDLGFRNSLIRNYGLDYPLSREQVDSISKKWIPYRSIAAWYLWRAID